jgi:hypothetical protein
MPEAGEEGDAQVRPATPSGRAARLKPACLWVRLPRWASCATTWLGRQRQTSEAQNFACCGFESHLSHSGRIPSWSSLECSPLCQGGGHGFKSRWGGLLGTVRKLVKRPSSNLGECLWVRLPPVLLEGLRSPGRSVKPPSKNVGVVDDRFKSFAAHCALPVAAMRFPARSASGEAACLSSRIEGFDSPTGC